MNVIDSEQQVTTLIQDFAAAALEGRGSAYLESVAHPAYVHVSAAAARDLATHLAAWREIEAVRRYRVFEPAEIQVNVVGTCAVATFSERIEGQQQGLSFARRLRWSMTCVLEDGRWWLLAEHTTPLPGDRP